jgi:two-component sensor histidine kinase/HAMP domain-containing protein
MKIRWKLIFYTLGIVLAVGTLLSLFSIYEGRRSIFSTYERECRRIIDLLSRNIANDVYSLDVSSLNRQLENVRINPDIAFVFVIDHEGEILSDGTPLNRLKGQKSSDLFSGKILKAGDWIVEEDRNLLRIGGPVRMPDGEPAGFLQAGFNLARAYRVVHDTTRVDIYVSSVCFALGALLAFLVSRSFTRPIRKLVEATEALRSGNFDERVDLKRRDEFGRLAESFNQMAENLKNTIDERTQAEGQLMDSLQEKEVLLKEIHHRVKNNLQIITSLLRLQAGQVQNPAAREILRESQNRVQSIAFIHDQLYLSKNFTKIDFARYFQSLAHHLFQSYGVRPESISLQVEIENLFLDMDLAIPCSIIFNELISNALKHAFPEGPPGKIEVAFRDWGKDYELMVRDNGIGLPENWKPEEASSLGLQLVTALVQQIQGKFEWERDGGTHFRIVFPKPEEVTTPTSSSAGP